MIYIDRLKKELSSAGFNIKPDMRDVVDCIDNKAGNPVISAEAIILDRDETYFRLVTKLLKKGNNFAFYDVGVPDTNEVYYLRCAVWE